MSRNLKRIAIIVATFLLIVGSLPFMSSKAQAADTAGTDKITIGTIKNTAAMPAIMAKNEGEFTRNNVDVDVKSYDSNEQLNDAIKNGEVNVATTDLVSYASFAKGSSWKIIGTLPGYYGLASNKKYKKIKNLKHKTIAVDKKSGSKQYLKSILKKNKVKLSQVKIKQIDSDNDRVNDLKSGKIDAAVLEDPSISNAKGNGAKILNRQKTNKDNGQILIVDNNFAKKNASSTAIVANVMNSQIKNINHFGYGVAQSALRSFGINNKGAKYITDMELSFKKIHKVKKSNFKKAFKYAKSQKNFKGKISYKKYTLKVKGVK